MVDLNRLNSGIKLIKEEMKSNARKNSVWSRKKQLEKISGQKNPHTLKSRRK
jgi:hypothetical protein